MYESPIEVYIEQAVQNIEKQRDEQICSYITEKFDVQVDRDELIKALQYDRAQYEKGYKEALADYYEAITNTQFLKYNYGISSVNTYFLNNFSPTSIIIDYKEWKDGNDRA